eukprot:1147333-Pelagomonas_calceolata.AAC.1
MKYLGWCASRKGSLTSKLSCPCRQVQLCNPILSYPILTSKVLLECLQTYLDTASQGEGQKEQMGIPSA